MDELDPGQTVRSFVPGQKVFGRYVLKTILGRGGMGVVWRGFDEHLERDVALKFLPELIVKEINDFRAAREKELQEQTKRMREGILAKITSKIKERAERENFNLVFDSSGESLNNIPIVLQAVGIPDLTDRVSD